MKNICEINKKISKLASVGEKFLFAIDFDKNDGFVLSDSEAKQQKIFFNINGKTNFRQDDYNCENVNINKDFEVKKINFDDYRKSFDKVMYHLKRGDTYLLNLTFKTEIITRLSLKDIFIKSNAPFKLLYKNKFVVFSPEAFVNIRGKIIQSFPMKGTIDASVINARKKILSSNKEFYEHNTIVDLIRNDLNIVANNVKVEKFRFIQKIRSNRGDLLQVSSKITGTLPDDFYQNLGDIILKLLPAGSVTGAPKEKTVQIIKDAETYKRGFYTGIFGYFDGKNLDSAVAIRFIENYEGKLFFKSGGGITALSDPESEYNELIQKIYVPIV